MSNSNTTRRDFMRATGASLAAASIGSTLASADQGGANQPPPARTFGYAVVGIGSLAEGSILPAFANTQRSRVMGLVSGDMAKARETAAQYGVPERGLYTYDTFDRITDNPDIHAVYIVLPNNLHAEYTIRAHKAGKHVLVEKPMANSVADCEAMIAAAKAAGRQLAVGYRLRYEPFTQAMIRMGREKEFGETRAIVAEAGFNIGNPAQWRLQKAAAGGGSMMDIGIYAVNAARYLSGEEPVEVNATEYSDRNDPRFKEVEDTIHFHMKFPSGVIASCISSYGVSLNRCRVHAQRGSFEMEPFWSRDGLRLRVMRGNIVEQRYLPQRDHFALMMDHLAEAATKNVAPLTDGVDGRNDMKVIEAVYESVRQGRPVKIA
jgi:predicted dehydrogenase